MFQVSVEFLPNEKVIKLTTLGTFDLAADVELLAIGIAAAQQYGTTKFLVDHRFVELKLRQMDVEDVPMIAERAGLPPNASIALLHSGLPNAQSLFSFVDDVSYLHGGPRRAFTDASEAMQWLMSRP